MNRLQKVKKGLRCCIKQADNDIYCEQLGCPYYEPVKDHARLMCWTKLNRDALKLLYDMITGEDINEKGNREAD